MLFKPFREFRARRGFSMLEFLVAIGVILILVGLIVPVLATSIDRSRLTVDLAAIRSNSIVVTQYSDEHGHFPIGGPTRCSAQRRWVDPLLESGLLRSAIESDPRSFERWGLTFYMSQSLVADPIEFSLGFTRPCDASPSTTISPHLILFPSAKGFLAKFHDPFHGLDGDGARWFCCEDRWDAPVSFCDGSAELGNYMLYSPGGLPPIVIWDHSVGAPIFSPWGGYTARER